MRLTFSLPMILVACLWSQAVYADIYVWIDENGITNFTNQPPPPGAEIFLKTMEGPHQEVVEETPKEMEMQRALERAQTDIRLTEERIAEKITQLEQETAEAKRETRKALERVEELEDAAERRYRDNRWSSTGSVAYNPGYYDYRHYGYRGYRFSVTYPGDKRHPKHRFRMGRPHKQVERSGHRRGGLRLKGKRHAQHRRHPTGQARFGGHPRRGLRH